LRAFLLGNDANTGHSPGNDAEAKTLDTESRGGSPKVIGV
jgi:hypothetical protein